MNLTTTYLGMELTSPVVASPSPLTGRLDSLLRLQEAGAGAVVLPSLFEEEVESEALQLFDRMEAASGIGAEAAGYFPDVDLDHLGLERHLALVEQASDLLDIPVIASLNGRTPGGWVRYAGELQEAGARAIELNTYEVVVDPDLTAADVEERYLRLVDDVRRVVDIPVSVKLSPYFTSMAHMARRIVEHGADGLVLFNRFYQPDLDLETLDVTPHLELSTESELRLPLRWTAILRPVLPDTSIGLTSGVHTGRGAAKALLAGADVVMVASELLREGPRRLGEILDELTRWMNEHEYTSVRQLQGSVAGHTAADPSAFERAQYQRVLKSWVS